jgi:hypothetical protein
MLVRAEVAPRRRVIAGAAVASMRPIVERLIERWDEAAADEVFAMNMDLDEPRELRRAAVAKVTDELGPLRPDDTRPATSDSPADLAWWLRGARGWARVSILVTPEPVPRLQSLKVTAVGDPSAELRSLAERVLALTAVAAPSWPQDLPLAEGVDGAAIERAVRAAWARFGSLRLGLPIEGDGRATSTFELETERGGRATLKVGLDPESGAVSAAALQVPEREAPAEAW